MDIQDKRLEHLKSLGFIPKVILDIGAHHGDWARLAKQIFPNSNILMFEANQDNEQILKNSGFDYEIALLGNVDNESVDYYAIKSGYTTGNSIFKEKSKHYTGDGFETRTLTMTTVDKLLEKRGSVKPNFIKMDVQGAELLVLEGCKNSLDVCDFILLETQTLEYNKNAPMMSDVISKLDALGYQVFDIFGLHYLPNQMLFQLDILFVKKESFFVPKGNLT